MKYNLIGEIDFRQGRSVTTIVTDMADLAGRIYFIHTFDGLRRFVITGTVLDVEHIAEYGLFYLDGCPVICDEVKRIVIVEYHDDLGN